MCLITTAGKGTKKNTEEFYQWIRNGAQSNNQGSGYAYKINGDDKIFLSKGFFEVEDMISDIKKAKLKENDELIVHHRIATSGTDPIRNTHPFVIDYEFEDITMVKGWTKKPVMAHNGIFSNFRGIDNKYNDTAHWIHIHMSNPHILNKLKTDPQGFYDDGYSSLTELNGNKLAFLFPDRSLIIMGNFTEDEGYYHSTIAYKNTSHYDRGGVSNNTKFLTEGKKNNGLETRDFTNDSKVITLKPETLYSNNVEGYREHKMTVGKNIVIRADITDAFLKLNFDNLYLFNFENPITKTWYFADVSGLKSNVKDAKNVLIPLHRYTEPSKIDCVVSLEDLRSYTRRTKADYISLIRDIYEINKLRGNKPSKNARKKLENALSNANSKKKVNISITGTERLISKLAIEMYLNNAKILNSNLQLAL